jgi:hypothetical protein
MVDAAAIRGGRPRRRATKKMVVRKRRLLFGVARLPIRWQFRTCLLTEGG